MKVAVASRNQFMDSPNLSAPISIPIHWLTHLFGCWHKKMGNPFTHENQTYCTCMECGAHRKFDIVRWKNTGPYYNNPVLALYESFSVKKDNKSKAVSTFEIARWVEDGGKT